MINGIQQEAEKKMSKTIDSFRQELTKLRTGRAHPSLLDHVTIDYYGSPTPLNQVGNISAQDARTLIVQPWEKHLIPDIEKAIHASDLGLNPVTSGDIIRIPLPSLNEERRRELVKLVKSEAETARVSIRNIRRDALSQVKDLLKAKDITEDDDRRAQDSMQKLTDKFVADVEKIVANKEQELMEV